MKTPLSRRKRHIYAAGLTVGCSALAAVLGLWLFTSNAGGRELLIRNTGVAPLQAKRSGLTVATLNLAHGRSDGANQIFRKKRTLRTNISKAGRLLSAHDPDVVALQEADAPSLWSGRFDHVRSIAQTSGMDHAAHGLHVQIAGLNYGTAVLSRQPLEDAESHTFKPSPPTFTKGYVVAAIPWPDEPERLVDIVSVHLDFSRKTVRSSQIKEMVRDLRERGRDLVIMGDFNCDWDDTDSVLPELAKELQLQAYTPEAQGLETFPFTKQRLDWILISPSLQFADYQVLPDTVSDHRAVIARLTRRQTDAGGKPAPTLP